MFSGTISLYRYDLQTGIEEYVSVTIGEPFQFNGKYVYSNRSSSSRQSVVFDLETESERSISRSVSYVDRDGRIYCTDNYDGSLYLYDSGADLNGTEVVKEENGFVYTRDSANPTVVYRYKAGVLQDTFTLPSENAVCVGDYSYIPNSNAVYDKEGKIVATFSNTALQSRFYTAGYFETHSIKILASWNDYIFVGFSVYEEMTDEYDAYDCFGFYRVGELDAPVAYSDQFIVREIEVVGTEEQAYLLLGRKASLEVLLLK